MATTPLVKRIQKTPVLRGIFAYYHFHSQLRRALAGQKRILDLGCGGDSPLTDMAKDFYSVGVDAFQPSIEKSKALNIHDEYCLMDVLDIDKRFGENSFDCVLALDLVEHLEKDAAADLIRKMEFVAKNKVIIFTPNGFVPQGMHDDNPFQEHKSGWTADEMQKRGYKVIGFGGLKYLRGELSQIKWKPRFFWNIISLTSQLIFRNIPKLAFSILCIKTKN